MNIHSFESTLLKKIKLTDKTYRFIYSTIPEFEFLPGQFAGIRVPPYPNRAYSIVGLENQNLEFIIDIYTKSGYFEKTKEGDKVLISGPYGIFKSKDTNLNKVFICTGSGIAPFISIIKDLFKNPGFSGKVDLYFGTRFIKDEYANTYFTDLISNSRFSYTTCITRPPETPEENPINLQFKTGRVTQVVPLQNYDYLNTEFYICGSNQMVEDMSSVLKNLGADKVYFEKYG